MSGNAFKEHIISRVTYDDYLEIKDAVSYIFSEPCKEIGSSQFFENGKIGDRTLGDIDFAIQLPKEQIKKVVQSDPFFKEMKVCGNTVSTMVQVGHSKFHVDFMPSSNIQDESWIMTSGSEKIKGVVRNMMLCYLANVQNVKESTEGRTIKHTIAFPNGIATATNGIKSDRNTSPSVILSTLGLDNSRESIERARTFEGLLEVLEDAQSHLEGFYQYTRTSNLYHKQPSVLNDGLEFLRNFE